MVGVFNALIITAIVVAAVVLALLVSPWWLALLALPVLLWGP